MWSTTDCLTCSYIDMTQVGFGPCDEEINSGLTSRDNEEDAINYEGLKVRHKFDDYLPRQARQAVRRKEFGVDLMHFSRALFKYPYLQR